MMKVSNSKKIAELVIPKKERPKTFKSTDKKLDLIRVKNAEDMFKKLGI
ncbi:MAG: hypothetical protein SFW07_03645 [Gammaproteobacteria bacterium]|nr:hypothetical protein [Gammaproteobacteria bacterium]